MSNTAVNLAAAASFFATSYPVRGGARARFLYEVKKTKAIPAPVEPTDWDSANCGPEAAMYAAQEQASRGDFLAAAAELAAHSTDVHIRALGLSPERALQEAIDALNFFKAKLGISA